MKADGQGKESLMAENVTGFTPDLSEAESKNSVGLVVDFKAGDKKYTSKQNFTMRNKVPTGADVEYVAPAEPEGIRIYYKGKDVTNGTVYYEMINDQNKQSSFYKGAIAMSKLRKKIVVPITLILVVCLVVGTLVIYDSLTSVEANVSFNGISNIVSSHGKDRPFNIVEVVPSKQEYNNMASIGYLIGGQEPVNSRQMLSTIIGDNGTWNRFRSNLSPILYVSFVL